MIDLQIPYPGKISIEIFNKNGLLVSTILDENVFANKKIYWNGKDNSQKIVTHGVYILLVTYSNGSVKNNFKQSIIVSPN